VQPAEVVGIIGHNGAGKSTLLKILSRITRPTRGAVELRGRVGSLLEVGTGFHPELTGRENIYLNGSILGMKRREINRRFDDIVAFSEVERFLNTPVKRYSSGMYVRLAFAVAAHLEPEILLVDEVLAVGDVQFQKRCLGKMHDVSRSGRTVFFVSHSMSAIKGLCTKVMLLHAGKVKKCGGPEEVVRHYLSEGVSSELNAFNRNRHVARSEECRLVDAWLSSGEDRVEPVSWDQPFEITMIVQVRKTVRLAPEYVIRDAHQYPILFGPTGLYQGFRQTLEPGTYKVVSSHEGLRLAAGRYFMDLILAESNMRFCDYYESALTFDVPEHVIPPFSWNFRQSRGQGAIPFAVQTRIEPYDAR